MFFWINILLFISFIFQIPALQWVLSPKLCKIFSFFNTSEHDKQWKLPFIGYMNYCIHMPCLVTNSSVHSASIQMAYSTQWYYCAIKLGCNHYLRGTIVCKYSNIYAHSILT